MNIKSVIRNSVYIAFILFAWLFTNWQIEVNSYLAYIINGFMLIIFIALLLRFWKKSAKPELGKQLIYVVTSVLSGPFLFSSLLFVYLTLFPNDHRLNLQFAAGQFENTIHYQRPVLLALEVFRFYTLVCVFLFIVCGVFLFIKYTYSQKYTT